MIFKTARRPTGRCGAGGDDLHEEKFLAPVLLELEVLVGRGHLLYIVVVSAVATFCVRSVRGFCCTQAEGADECHGQGGSVLGRPEAREGTFGGMEARGRLGPRLDRQSVHCTVPDA